MSNIFGVVLSSGFISCSGIGLTPVRETCVKKSKFVLNHDELHLAGPELGLKRCTRVFQQASTYRDVFVG